MKRYVIIFKDMSKIPCIKDPYLIMLHDTFDIKLAWVSGHKFKPKTARSNYWFNKSELKHEIKRLLNQKIFHILHPHIYLIKQSKPIHLIQIK